MAGMETGQERGKGRAGTSEQKDWQQAKKDEEESSEEDEAIG